MTKTDQQAAEDKDKKRLEWIRIIQSDKYAVRSKESKLLAGIEAGRSFDYGYDAGAKAEREKFQQLKTDIEEYFKRQPTDDCRAITPRTMEILLYKFIKIMEQR